MTAITCESADLKAETAQEVIRFLKNEILNSPSAEVDMESQLISEGLIDSMGIVRLMTHLQRLYSIKELNYADLTLDNFRTIGQVAAMVARYR